MKASFLRSLLMGCLLLSLAGQGLCEERRVIRAAIRHWPPSMIITQGAYSGIDVEILRLIAKQFNWKMEFIECPAKRCFIMLEQGELDISSGRFSLREAYLYFVEPPLFVASEIVFYFQKRQGFSS